MGVQQQAGHSDHTIHRGADLMAHRGKKISFRLPGRFCCNGKSIGMADRCLQLLVGFRYLVETYLQLGLRLFACRDV